MKFLLTASINHQELKEKFTEHLAEIGEKFETFSSYVRTFPKEESIRDHVLGIYTIFLSILRLSIDWCRENGFGEYCNRSLNSITLMINSPVKFAKSVAHPYSTRIKPLIEEMGKHVQALTERVDAYNAMTISHLPTALLSLGASIQTGLRDSTQEMHTELMDLKKALKSLKAGEQLSTDLSTILNMVKVIHTAGKLRLSTNKKSSSLRKHSKARRTTFRVHL